jgi:hypothetical protein
LKMFGKSDHSKGFVTAILLTVSLWMACGRSGMLGPDEVEEGTGGAGGAITSSGAGGRSSGSFPASLGGARAGGSSSLNGGASAASVGGSKPVGSGGAGGSGGARSVVFSSTQPMAGASVTGGAASVVGGVSAVAGSKSSGGTSAIGGSTSTVSCADAKSCGGDVVGTWNVTSSCLTVSGQMDLSAFGLDCSRATVTGSLQTSGMWIARASGAFSDKTTTSGTLSFSLPMSCLKLPGTAHRCEDMSSTLASLGYTSISCIDPKGAGCLCRAEIKQLGSMGIISLGPWTSGVYETTGNVLVIDSSNRYGYCVSGTQMTLTPQGENPPTTGAIVFQKQ